MLWCLENIGEENADSALGDKYEELAVIVCILFDMDDDDELTSILQISDDAVKLEDSCADVDCFTISHLLSDN